MKASKLFLLEMLVLLHFIAVPAMAITFTGDVEVDFDPTLYDVLIIPDPGNPGGVPGEVMAGDNVSGWDIKDLRLTYDADNDIMYVAVNSYGIVGDVDGNGSPDTTDLSEFTEEPNLCGGESVAVYFDLDANEPLNNLTSWDFIVGVRGGFCWDYFVVAEWDTWVGEFNPPENFGPPLPYHFDLNNDPNCPSSIWSDYELKILNWSEIPETLGLPDPNDPFTDPNYPFRVGAYMGSPDDGEIGADFIYYQRDPVSNPNFTVDMTCSPSSPVGEVVYYTVIISNTGDTDLHILSVEDNVCNPIGIFFDCVDVILQPGEGCMSECYYIIHPSDPDPLVNAVTVQAQVVGGPEVLTRESNICETDLVEPERCISIEEVCEPSIASIGDLITYTITICNCGDVNLMEVTVEDDLLGDLSDYFPDFLAPGQCDTQEFTRLLETTDPNPLISTAIVNAEDDLYIPVDANDSCQVDIEDGKEGCVPGFWKNSPGCWGCVDPDLSFNDVFDVVITVRTGGKKTPYITDPSLMQALNANGGGINAMARHAVAALLNACDPDIDYPMTVDGVITAIQAVVSDGDIQGLKDELDLSNNLGCPYDTDQDTESELEPDL
jgi:hypothetical protein